MDALTRWARKWLGGSKGRTLESLQAAQGKLAAERAAHETALANHGDERRELLLYRPRFLGHRIEPYAAFAAG